MSIKIFEAEKYIIDEMKKKEWYRGLSEQCNQFYSLFDNWESKTKNYHSELELIKKEISNLVNWTSCEKESIFFEKILNIHSNKALKGFVFNQSKKMKINNDVIFQKKVKEYYTLKERAGEELLKLFFYSEIMLKVRSAQIIFENSYSFDGIGLLRAALELNNGLLAFRETKDIKFIDYLEILLSLSKVFDVKAINKKNEERMNIEKKIRENLFCSFSKLEKEVYLYFLNSFHSSIHSSTSNLGMKISAYMDDGSLHNLFVPEYSDEAIGNFISMQFMIIFITLKNLINEECWQEKEKLKEITSYMLNYFNEEFNTKQIFETETTLINLLNKRY